MQEFSFGGGVSRTGSPDARINSQMGQSQLAGERQSQQQSQQLFELLFGTGGDGSTGAFQDVFLPAFGDLAGAGSNFLNGGGLQVGQPGSLDGGLGQPGGLDGPIPGGPVPGLPIPGGAQGAFALGREQQALGLAQQFGDSQRQRISRDFDASVGSAMGRLEAGGLGSSNLTPGTLSQHEEARQQSLLGLEDALLGQQLGIIGGTTDQVLNAGQNQQQLAAGLIGSILGGIF
jgi:hypothetical protein